MKRPGNNRYPENMKRPTGDRCGARNEMGFRNAVYIHGFFASGHQESLLNLRGGRIMPPGRADSRFANLHYTLKKQNVDGKQQRNKPEQKQKLFMAVRRIF
jgi:hypothetical protein